MEAEEPIEINSSTNSFFKSRYFILLVLLVVLLTATYILIDFSSDWFKSQKIEKIELGDTEIVDRKKVSQIANNIALAKTKDSVLLKKIEIEIEKFEYVENCIANFQGISSIEINIKEKEPVAFYLDRDNLKYLDINCEILPYKNLKKYSDLIIISNVKASNNKLLKGALRIVQKIVENNFLNILTSEVHYNNRQKYFEIFGNFASGRVIFGHPENIEAKLKNLSYFLEKYSRYKELETSYQLDIRWNSRVILKEI